MVEYAILVAHNSASLFSVVAGDVSSWASRLDSGALLRVAFGAFTRSRF